MLKPDCIESHRRVPLPDYGGNRLSQMRNRFGRESTVKAARSSVCADANQEFQRPGFQSENQYDGAPQRGKIGEPINLPGIAEERIAKRHAWHTLRLSNLDRPTTREDSINAHRTVIGSGQRAGGAAVSRVNGSVRRSGRSIFGRLQIRARNRFPLAARRRASEHTAKNFRLTFAFFSPNLM
jgi:hypothetical protein